MIYLTDHECIYFGIKFAKNQFILLLGLKFLTWNISHEIIDISIISFLSYFTLKGGEKTNNIYDTAYTQKHILLFGNKVISASNTQTFWRCIMFYMNFFLTNNCRFLKHANIQNLNASRAFDVYRDRRYQYVCFFSTNFSIYKIIRNTQYR
jgi:hypothetical protein